MESIGVGEFLRKIRENKGLSMRAICRMSGKSVRVISELERGVTSPTERTLREICPFYGVEPWEAMAGKTREDFLSDFRVKHQLNDPEMAGLLAAAKDGEVRQLLEELAKIAQKDGVEGLRRLLSAYSLFTEADTQKS